VDDPTGYLHAAADKAIANLEARMSGFDGQQSQEVAQVIVNVAHLGMEARKVTDVPFSVGTNRRTQALITSVRTNPTGRLDAFTDYCFVYYCGRLSKIIAEIITLYSDI
jgi:hypothetical protein